MVSLFFHLSTHVLRTSALRRTLSLISREAEKWRSRRSRSDPACLLATGLFGLGPGSGSKRNRVAKGASVEREIKRGSGKAVIIWCYCGSECLEEQRRGREWCAGLEVQWGGIERGMKRKCEILKSSSGCRSKWKLNKGLVIFFNYLIILVVLGGLVCGVWTAFCCKGVFLCKHWIGICSDFSVMDVTNINSLLSIYWIICLYYTTPLTSHIRNISVYAVFILFK